jgi:outer membrane protein
MNEENNLIESQEENQTKPIIETKELKYDNAVSCKTSKCGIAFNIFIFIAVAVLFILHFTSKKEEVFQPVSIKSALTIAYVNSDTIWENYEFVKDTKKELENLEMQMNNNYKAQGMAFKAEYENYLKIGATLTLNEQKKREAALQQKQQDLMELEKNLGNQMLEKKQNKNIQVQDSIFAYIKRFNHGPKYSFILEKSRLSGILFANDSLDITNSVLKGLNEAYKKEKKQ